MIEIEFDDRRITQALRDLQQVTENLIPAFLEIKEHIIESTQNRFVSKIAPDGSHWKNNSDVTIDRKGRNDPLVDGGYLNAEFGSQINGDTLLIYPEKEYAAMQQFGGTKSEFPYLWGDIPARPFLGISIEDESAIFKIIQDHIDEAIGS